MNCHDIRARLPLQLYRGVNHATRGAPAAPAVVDHSEPAMPPQLDERLKTISELISALAVNMDTTDRDRQDQFARLKAELASLQQQSQRRWSQTERDVSALYTAQF